MTTDRAGSRHRVIAGSERIDKASIEIDQVGIGRNCRTPGGRHTMGIVTGRAGNLLDLDMRDMTVAKGRDSRIKERIRIVATKAKSVVAGGIGHGVTVLFILGQQQMGVDGTVRAIGPCPACSTAVVTGMAVHAIDRVRLAPLGPEAGHMAIFT